MLEDTCSTAMMENDTAIPLKECRVGTPHCGMLKPVSEFRKGKNQCKSCGVKYTREYERREENIDRIKVYGQNYRQKYYKIYNKELLRTVSGALRNLYHNSKSRCNVRSRRKQVPHDITIDDIFSMWEAQQGICARTGMLMSTDYRGDRKRHIKRVSLDRIDSSGGYTKNNIQLVCSAYNYAKNDGSDEEVREVFEAYRFDMNLKTFHKINTITTFNAASGV